VTNLPHWILAFFLFAFLVQPVRADVDASKLGQVKAKMQVFVDQKDVAGVVAVIGRRSGILSHEAVGSLNLAKGQPMPKDALFRIASMTKPITALGIMMLVDEGKLSVEDPVEKHLPEFRGQMVISGKEKDAIQLKKPSRPITIRDLLTHTSGLTTQMPPGLGDLYRLRNRTLTEAVLIFSQRPLEFEPGSRWAYCNPGIDTLGRIIEVASGMTYEDFLHKRLFAPLGMKDSTFYPAAPQRDRLAGLYEKKGDQLVAASNPIILQSPEARYPIPAGGLWSTGADLARLYQMMLGKGTVGNSRFLSEKSIHEMTRVQTNDLQSGFTPGMGFGFGWAVVRKPQGVTGMLSASAYGHGGAFGTQGWIDPEKDMYVILLIQRVGLPNADASKIRQELQEIAVSAVGK
jgi:CubicO group peptidase (beta-lactamase class C family)